MYLMKTPINRISQFLVMMLLVSGILYAEPLVHILKRGDTLYSISRQYGVPADAIMAFNNISNPDRLQIGQSIKIPDVHVVQRGDTLFGIARTYGITVDELASSNRISRDAAIRIGQNLYIPRQGTASVSPVVPSGPGPAQTLQTDSPGNSVPAFIDPRSYESRTVDRSILWPVPVVEISYLTGKVFGVTVTSNPGAPVKTVASGTVVSAGPYRGFGQVVFVQGKNGYIYAYGGLGTVSSRVGQQLGFGDTVGTLGQDALSGKHQLYFMVYNRDQAVDPAKAPRGL